MDKLNNQKTKHVHPDEFDENENEEETGDRLSLLEAQKKIKKDKVGVLKRLFSECLATFILTFWTCGIPIVNYMISGETDGDLQVLKSAAVVGIIVTVLTFALGNVSGAHMSNAVTFGFLVRGIFPVKLALGYIGAQIVGGFMASGLLRLMFGTRMHVAAPIPLEGHQYLALGMETVVTFLEVFTVLTVATREKIIGSNAALAYGMASAVGALLSEPISSAGMNPAETFGPAVIVAISGDPTSLKFQWVYILGPLAGSAIATGVIYILKSEKSAEDLENAAGEATL